MRTINLFLTFMLLFFISGAAQAQVSNTRSVISGPGQITVTYDLVTTCGTADVTLYYSPNKCDWYEAVTVSGALTSQTTGNDKQIIWDNAADHVTSGKIYFKVETPVCLGEFVEINGIRWAKTNLDVGGVFAANETDFGALYQWGRATDGHESRTSARYPTNNMSVESGIVSGADLDATTGQVAATSGAFGKFIKSHYIDPNDWRSPQKDDLWNSGDETSPVKTVNDPCPAGWRVPTQAELSSLIQTANVTAVWTFDYNSSGVNGTVFTDNATFTSIFLPAADYRYFGHGNITGTNSASFYWSSRSTNGGKVAYLYCINPGTIVALSGERASGFSIRCVQPY